MQITTLSVGMLGTQCYIVFQPERQDCVVIDPGAEPETIRRAVGDRRIAAILLTHGHFDHIGAVDALRGKDVPVLVHALDAELLDDPRRNVSWMIGREVTAKPAQRLLKDGDTVDQAGVCFQVLHTPGHTAGSVCYAAENELFTGDTLFLGGGYGRTDLPGGDANAMRISLRRLMPLTVGKNIHPGH